MANPVTFPTSRLGDPPWEIARLFPEQGSWDEYDYLALNTNRLVEFANGSIEVLPLPTLNHQLIAAFIYDILKAFVDSAGLGGKVLFAPYKLRIPTIKYREPDVMYLTKEQLQQAGQQFTKRAELLVEVVSPDDPDRDYVVKREDYAAAGTPEYWIVDAQVRQIQVLRLDNGKYVEHGLFSTGQTVQSHHFPRLSVSVDSVFSAGV